MATGDHQQQRVQQLADAEARRWWSDREAKAEKDMLLSLHKRMEAQRAQIHAFKLEQSKWEHELQLRISKYAHDRKLLSEHNIELQEAQTAMEERYAKLQRESDLQAAQILELEAQLREARRNDRHLSDLRAENESLSHRLMQWESFNVAEVAAAVKRQEDLQNGLISALEQKLDEVLKENERLRHASSNTQWGRTSRDYRSDSGASADGLPQTSRYKGDEDSADFAAEATQSRIAELEKACKQKDQSILSLRSMLERHEVISDDKMKMIQAKYGQVKAINIALQRKLLHALTDAPPESNEDRIT